MLKYQNPLRARFERDFFKKLPQSPGVYRFFDRAGNLLYVGKAKNLRNRVKSYTTASPDRDSRKTLRMIHLARRIEVEVLDSEERALLRENELLRILKPPFNVMNTRPETYLFQHLKRERDHLTLHLGMNLDESYPHSFGAFKSRSLLYNTQSALIRLLCFVYNTEAGQIRIPSLFLKRRKLEHQTIRLSSPSTAEEVAKQIKRFYSGVSPKVIDVFDQQIGILVTDSFMKTLLAQDLETLRLFYSECARKTLRLKRAASVKTPIIGQQDVDDLSVRVRFL